MESHNKVIHIPKPDIFSFNECLHFLDRGYDDCLYTIEGKSIIKPLIINGEQILIRVSEELQALTVEILSGKASQKTTDALVHYVTEWFDLGRDLRPFYQKLEEHDQLHGLAERYRGLRLMGIPDLFEALCWCVIGQQINLTFAHRLKRRLVETYGSFITHNGKRHHLFPEPDLLAGLQVDELKALQFSRQKAEYIIDIAKAFKEGHLSKQEIAGYDDTPQMLKRLKEIRGVGDWTANYVLMKSLGRTDCITWGDTGLQSAVSAVLTLNQKPSRKEIEHLFEPVSGWESYLNIYLWRTLT